MSKKPTNKQVEDALAYVAAVKKDPVGWVKTALGHTLWKKQAQIMEAIRDNTLVTVRSANAVGKSFVAACAAIWYLECHCPGYVVTTSSSWTGVEKVLWPEIHRLITYAPTPLGGRLLKLEWQRGPQWGAFGVSTDVADNFAGFRTPHGVFVIVDEASALESDIMEAIMGLTATGGSKVLLIGNPLRPSGPFYESFASPHWTRIGISALESPNVVYDRAIYPGLATKEWVDKQEIEWKNNQAAYSARVLGEFPEETDDIVIPKSWCEAALKRTPPKTDKNLLTMGCDIARGGGDRIVLLVRDQHAVRHIDVTTHKDLMSTTGRIIHVASEWGVEPERVKIDDIGLGGGVTDRLRELDWPVMAVNFGKQAYDRVQFFNLRSEAYWRLREALDPNKEVPAIAIPEEYHELAMECSVPLRDFTSKGQIKLESKKEIMKRLGHSPDLSDAFAISYAYVPSVTIFIPGESHIKRQQESGEVDVELDREAMLVGDTGWK